MLNVHLEAAERVDKTERDVGVEIVSPPFKSVQTKTIIIWSILVIVKEQVKAYVKKIVPSI